MTWHRLGYIPLIALFGWSAYVDIRVFILALTIAVPLIWLVWRYHAHS